MEKLVRSYLFSSVVWLLVSIFLGMILSLQLLFPSLLGGIPELHFGRLRPLHVNGIAFGWLTLAYFGLALYIVQRLSKRELVLFRLAQWALPLWNFVMAVGLIAVLLGQNQGVEVAELPAWADLLVVIVFLMVFIPVMVTTIKGAVGGRLYVSLWYIIAAFLWTALNYLMGNTLPAWLIPGAAGANIHSTYLHDVVGLWVTPMGIAVMYYFLPLLTDKPIYSHRLSLIGFWSLAFFYPLNTAHHYLLSPIPFWVQIFAIAASVTMLFVVYTVMYNFFATVSGQWAKLASSVPLRFLVFGALFYILTCTQGPLQTLLPFQKVIHFTDWVIGHAHLALLGVFTLWNFTAIYFLWERFTGRPFHRGLAEWHFWLTLSGMIAYVASTTIAGVVQGYLWQNPSVDFMQSVRASFPLWSVRSAGGLLITVGQICFAVNLFRRPQEAGEAHA